MSHPGVRLVAYQRRWLEDRSRLRICLKARRIGMSFAVALDHSAEAVGLDLLGHTFDPGSGVDQLLLSTGERKAADLLSTALQHVRAFELTLGMPLVDKASETRIKLRNGRQILSLPGGNADAVHGWTGSVVLDEASRISNDEELFGAAYFVANPTLGRPEGYRLSVVSTPNGARGLFHRLWTTEAGEAWNQHRIDIYQATADGFPIDVEEERQRVADPDLFGEQMECNFLAGSGAYISAALYDACTVSRDEIPTIKGGSAGFDVARKKDASASVEAVQDASGVL